MPRDLDRLAGTAFDLLVVGGGIHGLFVAWDAAHRGLSVALIDQDDYGSGLTFNHQRTIHGGLRALEALDVQKAVAQIAERRAWATTAPAYVRPLPFVLPIRTGERPSRLTLWAGLHLYDLIGRRRNTALPPGLHLPPSRLIDAEETLRLFPGLPADGVLGGASWADYQTIFPDRVSWLVALAARRAGAYLVNHVEASEGLRLGSRITGARVVDRLTNRTIDVRARVTILAGGASVGELYTRFALHDHAPPLVAAANILVNRPARRTALARRGPHGRRLTAVPWGGFTLVGTFQSADAARPREPFPFSISDMVQETNTTFPGLNVTATDVRLVHRGLVAGQFGKDSVDLLPEPAIIRHGLRGVSGVVSLIGAKFTTARTAAAAAVDAALDAFPGQARSRALPVTVLPYGACGQPSEELLVHGRRLALDEEAIGHLAAWYGTEALEVLAYAETQGLASRLSPNSPVLAGEIAYGVDRSDAYRLADVVLRRTWLGATGEPDGLALERAAAIAGDRLGWSQETREEEIQRVRRRFATPPSDRT